MGIMTEAEYAADLLASAGRFSPINSPVEKDWVQLERELGVPFPGEVKRFISYFGEGTFGNGLKFINPLSEGRFKFGISFLEEYVSMSASAMNAIEAGLWRKLFPGKKDGLVFLGGTGTQIDVLTDLQRNGDIVLLSTSSNSKFETHMGIFECMWGLYHGKLNDHELARELQDATWGEKEEPFFRPHAYVDYESRMKS